MGSRLSSAASRESELASEVTQAKAALLPLQLQVSAPSCVLLLALLLDMLAPSCLAA